MRALPPVRFRALGQYDHDDEVEVAPDGAFRVRGGTYRSRGPREGQLSPARAARLAAALAALAPGTYPAPEGAEGFRSELVVGEGDAARRVSWWGPPPADDPALAEALALLRTL